ncbi:MAG: hypothetical protein QXX20_01890 [Candidatus Thermoplasmatota archaeon]
MRLRDGQEHWLEFPETLPVVWHKGEAPQDILHLITDTWRESNAMGFDIVVEQQYIFSQPFYTATVHGIIYKDMGTTEYKSRNLLGYKYYLENNLINMLV